MTNSDSSEKYVDWLLFLEYINRNVLYCFIIGEQTSVILQWMIVGLERESCHLDQKNDIFLSDYDDLATAQIGGD